MSIEHQYFIRSASEGTNITKLISANTPDKLAEGKKYSVLVWTWELCFHVTTFLALIWIFLSIGKGATYLGNQ